MNDGRGFPPRTSRSWAPTSAAARSASPSAITPAKDADTAGPFGFADVRFRNVNPTGIQGLTGSTFTDVCFESVRGNANPWVLDAHSTGNTFVRVSPAPGGGAATGRCAR